MSEREFLVLQNQDYRPNKIEQKLAKSRAFTEESWFLNKLTGKK